MNQQLRIIKDPNTVNFSLEKPTLGRRYNVATGNVITITTASAAVFAADKSEIKSDTPLYTASLSGDTIVDNTGELELQWDQTTIDALVQTGPKLNYKIVWLVNGTDQLIRWYDIVYWKLENPISESDLLMEKPELDEYRPESASIQITSVTNSLNFVCKQLSDPIHFWKGSIMQLKSETGKNERQWVADWDFDTRTLTIAQAFTSTPQVNDRFILRRGFYPEINSAWLEILSEVMSWQRKFVDYRGHLIAMDGYDFRLAHLYRTMSKIAHGMKLRGDDSWDGWIIYYNERYGQAINSLRAKVDADLDALYDYSRDGSSWATM